MDLKRKKQELRKLCREQRRSLTDVQWKEQSDAIFRVITGSDEYQNAVAIHCYVSMNDRFEVNTHPLLNHALELEKRVIVPEINSSSGTLTHSELRSLDSLVNNSWGVPEPEISRPADPAECDLILVPLLAADRNGNRLGYGKGYYDKFLESLDVPAFGLLFSTFILDEIPSEPFDQKLNGLFTENGLIYT